ncbi:host cell division inhibitor Icd-like protein [Leclercia sp.]|uniref:host cell division inhibitor Icd-like protein n=1 Tax=Leclercia sp. TaxID=1898428 RepID=UPI003FA59A8F
MVDKTKAALQGRQWDHSKQNQHTWPAAGGQSQSAPLITGAEESPEISGDIGTAPLAGFPFQIPPLSGCTSLQHTQYFRHWRGYAPMPYTPKVISPKLGRSGVAKMQLGAFPQCGINTGISHIFGRLIFNRGSYALSASLVSLRWRRLISFSNAVTTNCPVLSPSFFKISTASATWCGTRTSNLFDFALMDLVAITQFLVIRCRTIIYEEKVMAILDVSDTSKYYVSDTLILLKCKNSEARQCWSTNRASDHNVIETYIMADQQHTQSHLKYTWRFLALNRHDKKAKPCRLSVDAVSEREARSILAPHFILPLAARLPITEVCNA